MRMLAWPSSTATNWLWSSPGSHAISRVWLTPKCTGAPGLSAGQFGQTAVALWQNLHQLSGYLGRPNRPSPVGFASLIAQLLQNG